MTGPDQAARVHVLPYAAADNGGSPAREELAPTVLAHYVRWLLASGFTVHAPDSDRRRPVRGSDICVLTSTATEVGSLLRRFAAFDIEYSARGGALFLGHPLVRQYLLGLRALADKDDGIAETALLRPPFFAIDWDDVAGAVLNKDEGASRARVREARDIVKQLSDRRHQQLPGTTARDLIERTALGRAVVSGPNGAQTLAALYQVAAEVERRSALAGLDYDSVTELARAWAVDPIALDVGEPVGDDAVRVMDIGRAGGREFAVVIVWDGVPTIGAGAGGRWTLSFASVDAMRACDLLVIPEPRRDGLSDDHVSQALIGGVESSLVQRFEKFSAQQPPPWAVGQEASAPRQVVGDADLQRRLDAVAQRFDAALQAAAAPIAVPTTVTAEAAGVSERDAEVDPESDRLRKAAGSRFGPRFGVVVHRALDLLLGKTTADAATAVALAMAEIGFGEHAAEAAADVGRATAALVAAGVTAGTVVTGYPLSMLADGRLLSGFIDLVAADDATLTAIDFKTDMAPKAAAARVYPEYAAQLRLYGDMLRAAGVVGERELRLGLLFTESGRIDWV